MSEQIEKHLVERFEQVQKEFKALDEKKKVLNENLAQVQRQLGAINKRQIELSAQYQDLKGMEKVTGKELEPKPKPIPVEEAPKEEKPKK